MGLLGSTQAVIVLPEHRFDYLNLDDFRSKSCFGPLAYVTIFLTVFVAIIGYVFDIYILLMLHVLGEWASAVKPIIPFSIAKWIFTGCIALSFALLLITWIKAWRVIRGGGIASSYLDEVALSWSCIFGGVGMKGAKDRNDTGFKRFLVFKELTSRRSTREYLALFAYYSFHGWIRVAFAEGPRQVVNLLTLISVFRSDLLPENVKKGEELSAIMEFFKKVGELGEKDLKQALVVGAMACSLIIWVFSVLKILLAGITYLTFLWHLMADSNGLHSYCKERIDKRMKDIVQDKMKERYRKQLAKQPTLANITIPEEKPKISIPPPSYSSPATAEFSASSSQAPASAFGMKRTNTSSSQTALLSSPADMGYATPMSAVSRKPSLASMRSQFTNRSNYPQSPLPPYKANELNQRPYTPGTDGGNPHFGPPARSNTDGYFGGPENQRYPPGHFTRPGPAPGMGMQRARTAAGFENRNQGMRPGPNQQQYQQQQQYQDGYDQQYYPEQKYQQQGYSQQGPPQINMGFDFDNFGGNTQGSNANNYPHDQRSVYSNTPGPAGDYYDGRRGPMGPPQQYPMRTGTPASQMSIRTGTLGPGPIPRVLTPAGGAAGHLRRQGSQDSTYSQRRVNHDQQPQQQQQTQLRVQNPNAVRESTTEDFDVLAEYGASPEEETPSHDFPEQQKPNQQPLRNEPEVPTIDQPIRRVDTAPVGGNGLGPEGRMIPPIRSQTARPQGHGFDSRW